MARSGSAAARARASSSVMTSSPRKGRREQAFRLGPGGGFGRDQLDMAGGGDEAQADRVARLARLRGIAGAEVLRDDRILAAVDEVLRHAERQQARDRGVGID